jgi:dihydrofolate reductase
MPAATLSLIAAMSRNRVIGNGNAMPWHLPEDLAHFKRVTLGRPVIMGRKTMESILNPMYGTGRDKPLPGRLNIIVTRNPGFQAPGCLVAHSLAEAVAMADGPEAFVIGGAELFRQALPKADKVYLTKLGLDAEGDAVFPELDPEIWLSAKCTPGNSATFPYPFGFFEYVRRAPAGA